MLVEEKVIAPIIHSNGDRPAVLIDALETAYKALTVAKDALRGTAPNGRNYYVQERLFSQAQQQYWRRMQALESLRKELLSESRAIEAQEWCIRRMRGEYV